VASLSGKLITLASTWQKEKKVGELTYLSINIGIKIVPTIDISYNSPKYFS
jgi:hypothetical protein